MSLRFAFAALLLGLAGCASSGSVLRIPNLPLEARTRPEDFVLVTVHNEPAVLSTRAGATVRGYDATGAYVVTSEARHTVAALSHEYGLREVAGWPIDPLHVHCVVFRRPASVTVEALLARLERDPRVRLAQPLQTFATLSSYNDPYATLQTSLVSLAIGEAHRWSQGAGVRIAVIDTGVSVDHPDLAGSIIEKRNFVDDDSGGFARDLHGTEVAGVIAARANNHIGIVGIAPQAQLIALKACWLTADSPHAVCNSFTLAQALTAAVQSRARIVNLSLAGPADPLLAQ
ncbi:MAG TPA: S8 family serine peptidase, partial [Steroidobacteraceae bacterium]